MGVSPGNVVVTIETVKETLSTREAGCFLCKQILEDLNLNSKLTDHPRNLNLDSTLFSRAAKIAHLRLENIIP